MDGRTEIRVWTACTAAVVAVTSVFLTMGSTWHGQPPRLPLVVLAVALGIGPVSAWRCLRNPSKPARVLGAVSALVLAGCGWYFFRVISEVWRWVTFATEHFLSG